MKVWQRNRRDRLGAGTVRAISRRTLMKGVAAAGAASITAALISCGGGGGGAKGQQSVTLYRFQTRNARTCQACKNHSHYKVFVSKAAAQHHRAHTGCNCKIVTQQVTSEYWEFVSSYETNGVVDLRAIYG